MVLRKANTHSTLFLISPLKVAPNTLPVPVWLNKGCIWPFLSSLLFLSGLLVISDVMLWSVCVQTVAQDSQHFCFVKP